MTELHTVQLRLPLHSGVLHDRITGQLAIVEVSDAEADLLGHSSAALVDEPASAIYDARSLGRLMSVFVRPSELPVCCPVTLLCADGAQIDLAAFIVPSTGDDEIAHLDIYKAELLDLHQEIEALGEINTVMWNIIQMAREAIW